MSEHEYLGEYPPTTRELAEWLLRLVRRSEVDPASYVLRIIYTRDGTPFIQIASPKPEDEEQRPLKPNPSQGWGLLRRRGRRGEPILGPIEYDEVIPPDLGKLVAVSEEFRTAALPHDPAGTSTGLKPCWGYRFDGRIYQTDAAGEPFPEADPLYAAKPEPPRERRSEPDRRDGGSRPWVSTPRRMKG